MTTHRRVLRLLLLALAALSAPPMAHAQIAAGTVNAKQSGAWNLTNISGTISLPTGAATETSLAKLTIPLGTALGANTQALVGGSVLTAAPTYTTGQISPLSLTTGGLLRVDASGVSVPTTVTAFTTIATGQQAVTGTAAVLPTVSASRVCIKVLTGGTQIVYFGITGVSTSTGQELSPGDAWCGALSNVNKLFVIAATTGSTVAYDALN